MPIADTLIVFGGTYLLFVMACAVGLYGFLSDRVRWLEYGVSILGALALGYALARVAGMLLYHEQPYHVLNYTPLIPHAINNAFPSDGAIIAGVFAGIASLYNRGLGVLLWILAAGVAMGRMLGGVHYLLDVAVGLVLGGLCAYLAHWAVHLYFSRALHTK